MTSDVNFTSFHKRTHFDSASKLPCRQDLITVYVAVFDKEVDKRDGDKKNIDRLTCVSVMKDN